MNVERQDIYDIKFDSKLNRTPEGWLRGTVVATNTGIFNYRDADGTVVREARLDEDVFSPETLESAKDLPMTNDHPARLLDVENTTDHMIGYIGSNPIVDKPAMKLTITVTDKKAIKDIESGKRALSMGYRCDREPAPDGESAYDYVQKNIRYNHISLVKKGRAEMASFRLDSCLIHIDSIEEIDTMAEQKQVVINDVTCHADAEVIADRRLQIDRADAAIAELAEVKQKLSAITAKYDDAQEKYDAATKELSALKKDHFDSVQVNEMVGKRVALLSKAKELGVEVKDSATNSEIKIAIIKAKRPHAKLDGQCEDYVNNRFDALLEDLTIETERTDDAAARAPFGMTGTDRKDSKQGKALSYNQLFLQTIKGAK